MSTADSLPQATSTVRNPEILATGSEVSQRARQFPGTQSGMIGQLFLAACDLVCLGLLFTAGIAGEWLILGHLTWATVAPLVSLGVILLAAFAAGQTYATIRRHPVAEFRHTWLSILGFGSLATLAPFLSQDWWWGSSAIPAAVSLLLLAAIPATRYLSRHFGAKFSWWGRRVVIVGGSDHAVRLYDLLQHKRHLGLRPVGLIEELDRLSLAANPATYLGPMCELGDVAKTHHVSLGVLVAESDSRPEIDLLHEGNVLADWILVSSPADWPSLWVEPRELCGMPSLAVRNHLLLPATRLWKRRLDLCLAILIGIALTPVYGILTLLVWLSSPGPIFYSQPRVGRNGQRFHIWKFRSMFPNADQVLREHLERDPELKKEWEANCKLKNDPRVTWIGKILRKTSLDELPQLWNVLRGEMSLVGPRPLPVNDTHKHGDDFELYQKVSPGITGLWQISGRNDTTYEERVAYDAFYVRNWSLWFDLYILACTAKVVLRGEGAY